MCDAIIKPEEEVGGCAEGVHYHRICFDIGVANLSEELGAFARSRPDLYEELPNGKFRSLKNQI